MIKTSTTPDQISQSILATLAKTCPGLSCELGTPERKIIDAVSQAISAAYIGNYLTGSLLDVETKTGMELDQYVATFGFGRIQGKPSEGVVTVDLTTPLNQDYSIPAGTQFYTKPNASSSTTALYFAATQQVMLTAGSYSVEVPVKCTTVGVVGNLPPDSITFMGTMLGSSSCTNYQSMSGGKDVETDDELRHRFENTLLRNVAGTEDWYKALCLQNDSVSRVSVYGPVSVYRTQISAPAASGTTDLNVKRSDTPEEVRGSDPGSDVSYVWPGMESVFINLGQTNEVFYSKGYDYSINSGAVTPTFTNSGGSILEDDVIDVEFQYTSAASRNDPVHGITNKVDLYVDGATPFTVSETTVVGDSIITGTAASGPYHTDTVGLQNANSPYFAGNFERVGASGTPGPGNTFTRLNSCPVITFPSSITVGSVVYQRNTNYWLLKDTTKKRGSAYELSGIEWGKDIGPDANSEVLVNYVYNQTPEVLSAVMTSAKQICTDVMVHQADYRYIMPHISVQYSHGYDIGTINSAINSRLNLFFQNLTFGSWVDVSNMCLAIRQVLGVYNVYLTESSYDPVNFGIRVYHNSNDTSFDQETGNFKLADSQVAQFLSAVIRRVATP